MKSTNSEKHYLSMAVYFMIVVSFGLILAGIFTKAHERGVSAEASLRRRLPQRAVPRGIGGNIPVRPVWQQDNQYVDDRAGREIEDLEAQIRQQRAEISRLRQTREAEKRNQEAEINRLRTEQEARVDPSAALLEFQNAKTSLETAETTFAEKDKALRKANPKEWNKENDDTFHKKWKTASFAEDNPKTHAAHKWLNKRIKGWVAGVSGFICAGLWFMHVLEEDWKGYDASAATVGIGIFTTFVLIYILLWHSKAYGGIWSKIGGAQVNPIIGFLSGGILCGGISVSTIGFNAIKTSQEAVHASYVFGALSISALFLVIIFGFGLRNFTGSCLEKYLLTGAVFATTTTGLLMVLFGKEEPANITKTEEPNFEGLADKYAISEPVIPDPTGTEAEQILALQAELTRVKTEAAGNRESLNGLQEAIEAQDANSPLYEEAANLVTGGYMVLLAAVGILLLWLLVRLIIYFKC